jgi:Concanavalin A-like lectin/glucanases superfamily
VMRVATIVCAVFVALGAATVAWAAFSSITSNPSTFSANPDLSDPTVTGSIIAKTTGLTPGKIRQGGTYYVYANATDAGNPASGISSVTANMTTFDTGTGAVALTTAGGPWTVNAVSYSYRSALLTANTPLVTGNSYVYTVTANDNASHTSGATNFNVTIETYAEVIQSFASLVSYWRLDEAAGTTAADSEGTNTGTYTNTPTLNQATALVGDSGNSVRFNNGVTNEYVNIADNASLDFAGNSTIEAWIQSATLSVNNATVIGKGSTTSWAVQRNGGANTPAWLTNGTTAATLAGTANINSGAWIHIVVVRNGTTKQIYINGALDATATITGNPNTNGSPVRIAENGQTTGRYWRGYIDEVAVYNAPLTAADILDHYNAGRGTG